MLTEQVNRSISKMGWSLLEFFLGGGGGGEDEMCSC